jgi:hypothetical protein
MTQQQNKAAGALTKARIKSAYQTLDLPSGAYGPTATHEAANAVLDEERRAYVAGWCAWCSGENRPAGWSAGRGYDDAAEDNDRGGNRPTAADASDAGDDWLAMGAP